MGIDPDLTRMMRDVLRSRGLNDRLTQGIDGVTLDAALWGQLDELGLTHLTLSEPEGGSGATWAESAALLSEAAAAAVHLPLAETDLLAGWLLSEAGLVVDGEARTIASVGPDDTARRVPWAGDVERIAVLAHQQDRLVVADVQVGVLDLTRVVTRSGQPRYDVRLTQEIDGVPVDAAVADALLLRGALVRAIQSVGAMERALELCVAYTTERSQFGRSIAKFQSVQNLVADMAAEIALARTTVDSAVADATATGLRGDRSAFHVAVARSCVAGASTTVVRNAHQVHGAIGTTIEHPLQLFTLPLLDWRSEFGGPGIWNRALGRAVRRQPRQLWSLATGGSSATVVADEVRAR